MDFKKRKELYSNLYFKEVERIEKISSRLSLPFAFLIAISTVLTFLLNSQVKPLTSPYTELFWVFFLSSVTSLCIGAFFLRKAWFGHSDKLIPTAHVIESYYEELKEHYREYDQLENIVNEEFENFLFKYFIQFSSENAINNDKRSYNIYRALVSTSIAALFAFLAAIPFYLDSKHSGNADDFKKRTTTTATATASPECEGQYTKASAFDKS